MPPIKVQRCGAEGRITYHPGVQREAQRHVSLRRAAELEQRAAPDGVRAEGQEEAVPVVLWTAARWLPEAGLVVSTAL